MTAQLRDSIQKLRALSPRFNAAAEEASTTVKLVEQFLADECKAGITTDVTVWTKMPPDESCRDVNDFEGMFLGYGRVGGKYRITVQMNVSAWDDALDRETIARSVTPWTDCSRGEKLESFGSITELLDQIALMMETGIKAAAETSSAVQSIMTALAEKPAEQAHDAIANQTLTDAETAMWVAGERASQRRIAAEGRSR